MAKLTIKQVDQVIGKYLKDRLVSNGISFSYAQQIAECYENAKKSLKPSQDPKILINLIEQSFPEIKGVLRLSL